jgi:hypothetical protein
MSLSDDIRLRKEMLSMRAQIERMELQSQVQDVRRSLSWSRVLVSGVQKLMTGGQFGAGSALFKQFVTQYPMLAMVGSFGFTAFRKPLLRFGLKVGLLGAVGGLAYLWWRQSAAPPQNLNAAESLNGSTALRLDQSKPPQA